MRLAEADRLHADRRYGEAVAAYAAVLAAAPDSFDAWSGLAHASASLRDDAAAIPAFRRALALRPQAHRLRVNLARALFALGHVSDASAQNARAIAEGDGETIALAVANQAIIAPGDPALDNAAIHAMRRRWARAQSAAILPQPPRAAAAGRLKLAYYGSFFAARNWMKMYVGVINAHDRDRFELNLIVDGALPDAANGYRGHDDDRIWEVTGLPNAELAGHVSAAGIDVLVDLNGYSHPARLPLLAHRAAPVQIAWNGMYGTTGFTQADLLVGDRWTIPPAEERFCTEQVVRVSQTYLPFQVFYDTPPVAPPPCLAAGHVTFGSLNSAYKLTAPTLSAWAAVLAAVPGSRLLLRNRGLDHAGNRAELAGRLAALGIGAERLMLEGSGRHGEFLRSYDRIDIALDCFPYNGGTTTAEALWQGVPVLTIAGDRWAGRTSRSILMAAGLGCDVAQDAAGLVALAAGLAGAPQALAARRATQRDALAASPACDPAALCRELEEIYARAAENSRLNGDVRSRS